MTSEEKQEIINAVLAALRTNSKSIDQLTPVSEMSDTDFLELNGGRKVSYGVLFANHMSNDEAQESWEYLDTKKVDKDSRGLVEVHQAPVIYLDAMGVLDGHSLNGGDGLEYRPDYKQIFDFPGGLFGAPKAGAVYISKNNFKKFVWNGTDLEELKADECPLFVDYSEPVSFATLPVGGSYYVPSSHKIAVKIDASNTKTYDPLSDALYFFRDKGMIYTWKSSTNKWVPAGSNIKVVNNLTDGGEGDALSAEMGKRLKRLIDNAGVSFDVVDNRLCIMATGGASKTPAPTITAEIQTDGRALVTISAAGSGIAITYSINGGETQDYSQPFYIDTVGTFTITAKAQADGELPSNTVTATVTTESAGSVSVEQDTEDDTQFTATASDQTATVVITIGQQSQTGTGTATLSVAKTDELQTVTVTATASVTGKIAATASQQFTVSKQPNKLLQGTSTAAVTSIFIGDTEYKASEAAANGMQIVNTDNGDGTYTWTLDFGQNNIQTLIYGTDGKEDLNGTRQPTNIFGGIYDTQNTAVAHSIKTIDKIPDCVTRLGDNALYYCTGMTWLELAGTNIAGFGTGALRKCPARFRVDNDNFPIRGTSLLEVKGSNILSFRSLKSVGMQFESSPLLEYVIMPNTTGTMANGGTCWNCPKLKYISIGNPTPVSGTSPADWVYASGITELRKWFIGKNPKLRAVVIYESNPENTHVPTTLDNGKLFTDFDFSDPQTTDFRFYVPDAAVSAYKSHSMWNTLEGFIEPLSNAPTLEEVLAENN